MAMECRRRTGWTGGQRPQHVCARGGFGTARVETLIVSPFSTSARYLQSTPKISSQMPVENVELNRQTRVFRNAVTGRKQRAGARSNRQKNQIWTSENVGTVSTTASAFRNAFFAFLPGSAQQVEFAVTHSKQSAATFLPGSRIAFWRTIISTPATQKLARVKLRKRCVTQALNTFLTETASHSKIAVTHSKQSTGTFLTGARTASLAHTKSSNIDSKLSEGCAWLRL
jgi:hypothetical protein